MAHSANVISKIKLPRSNIAYELHDLEALHDASQFDDAGAAAAALAEAKSYTDDKISDLGAVLSFQGTQTSKEAIFNLENQKKGYVWLVNAGADSGSEYVYISDTEGQKGAQYWELLGNISALAGYVTKAQHNAHIHDVTVAGSNQSSDVTGTFESTDNFIKTATSKYLTASVSNVELQTSGAATALTGVQVSATDSVLGAGTGFTVSGGALTGASPASKDPDQWAANVPTTPAKIDVTKFTGGSLTDGGVSGGVFSGATQAEFTQGAKASWTGTVSDDGTLTIGWTTNGDDTFKANEVGSVSAITYTKQVLTPAAIQTGFYTAGTKGSAASFTEGTFHPNVVGNVSTIAVAANDADLVDAATAVSADGTAPVIGGVSVKTQPAASLSTSTTSSTGAIAYVESTTNGKVVGDIDGTAAAQAWGQTSGVSGTPKTQL